MSFIKAFNQHTIKTPKPVKKLIFPHNRLSKHQDQMGISKSIKKKLIHIQSKSQKNNLSKQDKGSVFANQCKRVRTIFMMIMLNYKQNQSCNWKKPKKSPDPTRKPPSNRAPIFGRPPPHLSVNLSTTQHQIKIGSRPIYQIRPKNHWNLPKKIFPPYNSYLINETGLALWCLYNNNNNNKL